MSKLQFAVLALFAAALVGLLCGPATAQYSRHVSPGGSGYGGYSGGYGGYGGYNGPTYGGATYGGYGAATNPSNLSLVVAQTQEGHEGVADLLGQLRRLQDQQVRNEVRFNTLNDSFYERQGVNFGFNLRGADPAGGRGVVGLDPTGQATPNGDLQFRQGGATSATPPFGGHDPASDASLGFATRGGGGDLLFNLFGGQGSSRSNVTQAPVVVIPNGGQGFVSDTSQTPFVTGVIPVVGAPNMAAMTGYGMPLMSHPQSVVQQRLQQLKYEQLREATQQSTTQTTAAEEVQNGNLDGENTRGDIHLGGGASSGGPSSADRGDLSVAEIRRQQAEGTTAEDAELASLLARAQGALDAGKANVAAIYYKMAARRAAGQQKQQIIDKLRELEGQ